MKYLTKDEIERLLVSADNRRDKLLIQLGLVTGCRVSELVGIRLQHVSRGSIKVYDYKKDIFREVVIDKDTQAMIAAYLDDGWKADGYGPRKLFYFTRRTADRIIKYWCEVAKIPKDKAHCHTLRHTYVIHSLEAGVPLNHVCEQTGDSYATIIRIYGRPSIDARQKMMQERGTYWKKDGTT